jgi:hypothetical protein
MLHAHDLLTLCLEEFIIRASRRYAGCREKLHPTPSSAPSSASQCAT